MEWREMVGVRAAAGSVLGKLYTQRGPLICVEQATFVLYLHSCWIGWDELWRLFWFAKGLKRRWAKMQVKPQKPWAPEARVCECVLQKRQQVPANMENWGESVPGLSKIIKASWRGEEKRIQSTVVQVFPLTLWLLLFRTFKCVEISCINILTAVLTNKKKRLRQSLKINSLARKPCPKRALWWTQAPLIISPTTSKCITHLRELLVHHVQ